jgi:hypothetical protein
MTPAGMIIIMIMAMMTTMMINIIIIGHSGRPNAGRAKAAPPMRLSSPLILVAGLARSGEQPAALEKVVALWIESSNGPTRLIPPIQLAGGRACARCSQADFPAAAAA